jgi:hypothetical protein
MNNFLPNTGNSGIAAELQARRTNRIEHLREPVRHHGLRRTDDRDRLDGLALIALGAAMLAAWRASRLDPNAALLRG